MNTTVPLLPTTAVPPRPPAAHSERRTTRAVGILFLAAFFAYGIGSSITSGLAGSVTAESSALYTSGAVLMLANSAIVVGIGVLLLPVLRRHSERIATAYLSTRVLEAALLAVGVVSLLTIPALMRADAPATEFAAVAVAGNTAAYTVGMITLGVGSLLFTWLLGATRLVPRAVAVWGFAGYLAFAVGSVLELFGVAGAGMIGAAPAGLFEVFFGVWLLVKGFRSPNGR
jgi:hypothetical protein